MTQNHDLIWIFAETEEPATFERYEYILRTLSRHFSHIETSYQSEGYVWIFEDGVGLSVDEFNSTKFEFRSSYGEAARVLANKVINLLSESLTIKVFNPPETW